MAINQFILKHDITLKKMLIEFTFIWIGGVIAFVVYTGLTFKHDFFIIDWYISIIDVVLLSIIFIVVDYIIYFVGKKKLGKVFK